MIEFLWEIALFAGKFVIIVTSLGLVISLIVGAAQQQKKHKKKKTLEITDIGRELEHYRLKVKAFTQDTKQFKKELKKIKNLKKTEKSLKNQKNAYILDFEGNIEASQVKLLREEVSILLKTCDPKTDEIIVRLNNRGGAVPNHGLGASQLQRLRDKGFKLTVCVDEVAGSGGYLMACTAHKILSAPFAVLGSIGVLAQIPNFYRFLQKQNVDFEEHHAGKHKRTLTIFGKSTEEKREKLREQLEEIHTHFKNYVLKHRPGLDLEKTATGEHWLGTKAKELGLVDEIMTSDEYILSLLPKKKIYHIQLKEKEISSLQKLLEKKLNLLFGFVKNRFL